MSHTAVLLWIVVTACALVLAQNPNTPDGRDPPAGSAAEAALALGWRQRDILEAPYDDRGEKCVARIRIWDFFDGKLNGRVTDLRPANNPNAPWREMPVELFWSALTPEDVRRCRKVENP